MALIGGFTIEDSGFTVGTYRDVCVECTKDLPRYEAYEAVGKLVGKRIYKMRSITNEDVIICEDCLKKILNKVKK